MLSVVTAKKLNQLKLLLYKINNISQLKTHKKFSLSTNVKKSDDSNTSNYTFSNNIIALSWPLAQW